MKPWRLKRTSQCQKCPWRKETNPHDIPNGYTEERHRALAATIAVGIDNLFSDELHVMACHELHEAHCIGWLAHQLGPGNNLALRLQVRSCTNAHRIRLRGEQHETFEDTLPKKEGDAAPACDLKAE